jgi:hypothetical protein
MTSSSAACVFAGARLISSASSTLVKTGPRRMRSAAIVPLPAGAGSSTAWPVMSDGSMSGVNWMRA